MQLLRTRAKQEQDYIFPLKYHDEIDARQAAVIRLAELAGNHEFRIKELESMIAQMREMHELSMCLPSPAPDRRSDIKRFPRYPK